MNRALPERCTLRATAILWASALAFSTRLAAAPPPEASQIMQQVYAQQAARSTEMRAAFEVFDRQGHSKKKEFLYRRLGSGNSAKVLAVFTAPEEVRGVALLSIQLPDLAAQQYIYTPATERVRSVVAQERSSRFLGTDFSYEEIGGRALADFSYRLLPDEETMDGHKTYKIEARPVDPGRSQYQYLYLWVAQDAPVVVYEQMYGAAGVVTRTLHATELRRVDGFWGARRTQVATPADGTFTVLTIKEAKFNLPLDEALFTPEALATPDAAAHK